MQELRRALQAAANKLYDADIEPELSRPAEQFGDYATNAALQLAKKTAKAPREIARGLAGELAGQPGIASVSIAGPGFINFKLTDEALAAAALKATDLPRPNEGQEILAEFGDPNPFKEMHIGHVYSYITGDAIAGLLEATGAKVRRLSYHGDVGLHIAKAVWAMEKDPAFSFDKVGDSVKSNIGMYYAKGNLAYEQDRQAKAEIDEINIKIYQNDPEIRELYGMGRQKSFAYFDNILKDLDVHEPERLLESQAAIKGTQLVKEHLGTVFEQSDGAIVYKGEKAGLHTRVFITSKGQPTYEAKDLGLAELKREAYPDATRSIIITAHEQAEYFKVMLAALAEIDKPLADMTTHLYHGFVSLSSGKMSSRTGEVYGAASLIHDVDQAVEKQFNFKSQAVRNAAIKYGFLKHRLGSDIVYDIAESISLDGNSGPYLQYAHARACSILAKSKAQISNPNLGELDEHERSLARKISEYPEAIDKAVAELMPHHVCTYLYELAQAFNSFYETSRIIGDDRETLRLGLVRAYRQVLKSGLAILNIEAPERL